MNRQSFFSLCVGLVAASVLGDQKVTNCVTKDEFISTVEEIVKQNEVRHYKQIEILRERVNELENLMAKQQNEYHDRFTDTEEQAYNYMKSTAADMRFSPTMKRIHGNASKRNIENLSDLGKDQVIVFSRVTTNIGNLYNAHTGVFYGVYVVFTTIVSEVSYGIRTYLDKDGSVIYSLISPHIQSDYGTCSNMAVIHLERGDSITVKSYNPSPGSAIDAWSTFSGFLLYPSL